jgi:hypothetical protein
MGSAVSVRKALVVADGGWIAAWGTRLDTIRLLNSLEAEIHARLSSLDRSSNRVGR